LRKQASLAYTRRTAPAYSVPEHPQYTYIHCHTHAHTHIQVTCEIQAHAHTAIVYYDSLQLTSSMHKPKDCDKGHRAHGQKEILHAYGQKSTPIAQGLVEDINAMHSYGGNSAPKAQGLVYDINAPHALGLRESNPNAMHAYGLPVSTPIAQGLVVIIKRKRPKIVMSPKAHGLVSNTHHGKKHMLKNCTHDRMSGGKAAK